jgi:hypothetical protein
MSDFDQRQYALMLKSLDGFSSGRMRIDTLISNLEGLLNALHNADKEWKQSFLRIWGHIEEARAYALSLNAEALDAEAMERVAAAVGKLRLMVLGKLRDPIEIEESYKGEDDQK